MPRSEQNLATLTRDFTQLRDNYDGLLRRRVDARMAVRLQQRWTEDFEILDPARCQSGTRSPINPFLSWVGSSWGWPPVSAQRSSRRSSAAWC